MLDALALLLGDGEGLADVGGGVTTGGVGEYMGTGTAGTGIGDAGGMLIAVPDSTP